MATSGTRLLCTNEEKRLSTCGFWPARRAGGLVPPQTIASIQYATA
ncbi:hypothetical protein [Acidovorax sp. WCS2018Cala2-18]|nr:hypothetical protein [Acidovorax sp. WCS2018Cala2-18]